MNVIKCIIRGGLVLNYHIDYIGVVRLSDDELNVCFKMEDVDIDDKIISVTLEYNIPSNQWNIGLLSHEFEGECPICGLSSPSCQLDEIRNGLLLEYLLDFLYEFVDEFKHEISQELK